MSRAPPSPFILPVGDLRRDRAEPREVMLEAAVNWHVELSKVLPEPELAARLLLSPMPSGLLVRGSVDATVRHTCHRCLDEWDEAVQVEVAELFVDPRDASEDDYVLEGDELDVAPLLRDEVLLSLPLLPACGEDCRGLVEDPESDLNTGVPEADDSRSPFAVLKDLFEPGE